MNCLGRVLCRWTWLDYPRNTEIVRFNGMTVFPVEIGSEEGKIFSKGCDRFGRNHPPDEGHRQDNHRVESQEPDFLPQSKRRKWKTPTQKHSKT
jgi:hypothetical protein